MTQPPWACIECGQPATFARITTTPQGTRITVYYCAAHRPVCGAGQSIKMTDTAQVVEG